MNEASLSKILFLRLNLNMELTNQLLCIKILLKKDLNNKKINSLKKLVILNKDLLI
jgi:hypothetical protein